MLQYIFEKITNQKAIALPQGEQVVYIQHYSNWRELAWPEHFQQSKKLNSASESGFDSTKVTTRVFES